MDYEMPLVFAYLKKKERISYKGGNAPDSCGVCVVWWCGVV